MTPEQFKALGPGDVVRDPLGQAYLVHANYGDRVTAARTIDLTNPPEWELAAKAAHIDVDDDLSEGEAFLRAAEEEFGPGSADYFAQLDQVVEIAEAALDAERADLPTFGSRPGEIADEAGRIIGQGYELIETGTVGIPRSEKDRAERYGWTVGEAVDGEGGVLLATRDYAAAEPFLKGSK